MVIIKSLKLNLDIAALYEQQYKAVSHDSLFRLSLIRFSKSTQFTRNFELYCRTKISDASWQNRLTSLTGKASLAGLVT